MFNRVIITSGPTVEPIDPVRYISNRSSGKTGFHLANEALKRGYKEIIFISGPSRYVPEGNGQPGHRVTVISVESALQMREQLAIYGGDADVIVMAAAVSDYRVKSPANKKIKKNSETMVLELIKNPDLLSELGRKKPEGQLLVGFAAETDDALNNAVKKFIKKNLDLLVLNEISERNPAFDVDQNQVFFISAGGTRRLETMDKSKIAQHIWEEVERMKRGESGGPR